MTIKGKVAAILNERELVVNVGSNHGVQEGMKFKVMELDRQIIDPDSHEILGEFNREKIRVKIFEVNPKYSVGSTYETYRVTIGSLPNVAHLFEPRREVTRVRTLRADNSIYLEPMDEAKSFVNIGDSVFQVEDDL